MAPVTKELKRTPTTKASSVPISASKTFKSAKCSKKVKKWLRISIVILTPIVFCFLLFLAKLWHPNRVVRDTYDIQLKWIYVTLVIGIYLLSNVLPVSIVCIIPFILLPLVGVIDSKKLSIIFMSNVNMIHFCSLIIVLAIHVSGLRLRLSLIILTITRGSIKRIYATIFFSSFFITMILNSCVAAYLMLNVVEDVLEQIKQEVNSGSMGDDRVDRLPQPILTAQATKAEVDVGVGSSPKLEEIPSVSDGEQLQSPESVEPIAEMENTENMVVEKVTEVPAEDKKSDFIELKRDGSSQVFELELLDTLTPFELENEALLRRYGGELLYAVAVAANIGGYIFPACSPVATDLFYLKYVKNYEHQNSTVKYVNHKWSAMTWLTFSIPLVFVQAALAFVFLMYLNFGKDRFVKKCRKLLRIQEERLCAAKQSRAVLFGLRRIFGEKYGQIRKAGWSFQEVCTIFFTIVYIILNFFRYPAFMPGWAELISPNPFPSPKPPPPVDVGEAVLLVVFVLLIFFTPKAGIGIFKGPRSPSDKPRDGGFLGWKSIQSSFPWAVLVLIAGSRSIGNCSKKTIDKPVAHIIEGMDKRNNKLRCLLTMCFGAVMNFILPNPGTSLVVQNVWEAMDNIGGHALLIPVLSVTTLTFMLPSSSVPNVIVYTGKLKKTLSPFYFLKVGTPIFILTLIPTLLYALCWEERGLTYAGNRG